MEEIFVIIPPLDKEEPKPSYLSALQPQHLTRKWEFVRRVQREQWRAVYRDCSSCCCRETFKAQGKVRLSHNHMWQDVHHLLTPGNVFFLMVGTHSDAKMIHSKNARFSNISRKKEKVPPQEHLQLVLSRNGKPGSHGRHWTGL